MSGFDDRYIYGLDGKQYYTPDRATDPIEDDDDYQNFYDIALDDLYNYVLICLETNGDLHSVLEDYIVRDFGDFDVNIENKDINNTIIEAVLNLQKKEISLKDIAFNAGLELINKNRKG